MSDFLRSNVLNFALLGIALLLALLASKGMQRRVAVVVVALFLIGLVASGTADDVSGWVVSGLISLFVPNRAT